MPRRRPPRRPPPQDDRDLAAEVLYLHSLHRRGPPARVAPAPVPVPAVGDVPHRPRKRKRRQPRRGAGDPQDVGPESPHAPSPPASPEASPDASPAESTPPSPGAPKQEEAVSNRDSAPSRFTRSKANKRRRRGLECDAAETQDAGSEKPLASSPPAAHKAWPDSGGPNSSKPPSQPLSPSSLAQREALRAAAEFFASHGLDEEEEEEVSESEGDEEEATGFFTGLFERDATLRSRYEQGWEEGQFACMACAGRKARRGKARRFRGCIGLVQHARAATRYGRSGAHRAFAAVVCRVLGWDMERLPSIVIDPRGTLGQELAARAQSDAQETKEDVETGMEGSNANGDETANELVTSEVPAGMKDAEEIPPLNCEESSKNNVHGHGHETTQEEIAVKTGMQEPASTDGEKEAAELNGDKESSEKDNANNDNSLRQDDNAEVHDQDIAMESTEKGNMMDTCSKDTIINEKNCMNASVQEEVNATVTEPEHAKTADDIETQLTLGRKENEEHGNSIS